MSFRRAFAIIPASALLLAAGLAAGQVPPAATTPRKLPLSGTLSYSVRYSESTSIGGPVGGQQMSIVSADATYANTAQRLPFSMQYGSGYGWVWAGPPSAGNVFQHLSFSQGWIGRAWSLTGSENLSYSFETPTTGFSGVPGSGEPIGDSAPTAPPDQTVLALNTRVFDNSTSVGFGERLSGSTSLNLSGSTGQIHFIDNNGLNTDTLAAAGGVTHRLDARDSLSCQYSFSRFTYSGSSISSEDNALQFSFTRQWNRHLSTAASIGPLWLSTAGISTADGLAPPNSTVLSLGASASYLLRNGALFVSYFHGSTGGSGYMLGSKVDSVNGGYSRSFGRSLNVGATGSYVRSESIVAANLVAESNGNLVLVPASILPITTARFGAVQASRSLGRYFSTFAGYTVVDQSSNLEIAVPNTSLSSNTNILSGISQVVAFGIAYSPRAIHLRK